MTKAQLYRHFDKLLQSGGPVIRRFVDARLEPRDTRLDTLEARILALEARPELRYVGIWRDGEAYAAGSLTTRAGSLWLAEVATAATPGRDGSGWRLIVKAGKA